jgi:hypothetical protein
VKILHLGEIVPAQTALMRMRALERLGHTVRGVRTMEPWKHASWIKVGVIAGSDSHGQRLPQMSNFLRVAMVLNL